MTATISYGRQPSFTRYASGQPTTFSDILRALDPNAFTELRSPEMMLETASGGVIVGRV